MTTSTEGIKLKEFTVKYNLIDETDKPEWWLCSYWG